MTRLERMGELLFKLRDYTPIPIVILALLFARPSLASLAGGLLVALLGEAARTYGVAFIGSISRTRSYSNGELVREGPFALLRNPLYFGNLVLSLGLAIMSGVIWLPFVVIVFFYGQYIPIVAWEERKLKNIFGDAYARYQTEVPNRWFPSLRVLLKGGWYRAPDTWAPALKSEKRTLTAVFAYVILMAVLFGIDASRQGTFLPLIENIIL